MSIKTIIRDFSQKEPLNPYQISGMASVIKAYQAYNEEVEGIELEFQDQALMILDRSAGPASEYLLEANNSGKFIRLSPKGTPERLDLLMEITRFQGRRNAIKDNLINVLYELPNWADVVKAIGRYSLERDDNHMGEKIPHIMDLLLSYLKASAAQPFDKEARREAEYTLLKIIEDILKKTDDALLYLYEGFLKDSMEFLLKDPLMAPLNNLERRTPILMSILSSIKSRPERIRSEFEPIAQKLIAAAIRTALGELTACSTDLVRDFERAIETTDLEIKQEIKAKILERIKKCSQDEIDEIYEKFGQVIKGHQSLCDEEIKTTVKYIRDAGEDWRYIVSEYEKLGDSLPYEIHESLAALLASQVIAVDRKDINATLVTGLCKIILRLEKIRKLGSRQLLMKLVSDFSNIIHTSDSTNEKLIALNCIKSIGETIGKNGYFLLAQDLQDELLKRPLIHPKERKYAVEDDDTGEPLVLAEDIGENKAHVTHLKTLLAIVASNPRIMYRLIPYITVQIEMRGARICDEDLIQLDISKLLRANARITHFPVRTLIKALPYSFKDIGPLDTLRQTAAGLAKELSNRGVKPIGNFLGKLRGDIHWRGSIDNFYFAKGIIAYLCAGDPEAISEWMPKESLPYLHMDCWSSSEEQKEILDLCNTIFKERNIDPKTNDSLPDLLALDTASLGELNGPENFPARLVRDMIDLVQGLYSKYFVTKQSLGGSSVQKDLDALSKIIAERKDLKDLYLTPDDPSDLPTAITLTEGGQDYVRELDRLHREAPDTPIISRAKKTGHAYAQRGSYIEERFEAFNKDISLESRQETLATSINNSHFDEITEANLGLGLIFLDHLVQGVVVNGHSSLYLQQTGNDLKNAGSLDLTYDKVRDLLRILKHELDDIQRHYSNRFEQPFDDFLSSIENTNIPRKLRELTTLNEIPESDFFKNYLKTLYISDLQARDGNLRVLEIFHEKLELFLDRRLADSAKVVSQPGSEPIKKYPFYFPEFGELSPCKIGTKASLLRFAENTPPYFVITTDRPYIPSEIYTSRPEFKKELTECVRKLEATWGRRFGDPTNPGLFSVRSGGRISMPGMMTTITNVGINDKIAESLSNRIGRWFAYDCYRRFLQEFSQAVFNISREEFQDIIDERKRRWRLARKAEMTKEQMTQLAFDYKQRVKELAPDVVDMLDNDRLMDILIMAGTAVMKSYESRAAQKFKKAARIDGNWRTPVIIQAMVYGNMETSSSGAGVVTYSPFTMELKGDFSYGDQGADVVDGKVATMPVYDLWKQEETMASTMPEQWKRLSSLIYTIAERLSLDVGLEYTIEKGEVFILQIRKQKERPAQMRSLTQSDCNVIARGTGVSGNIFRGIMVTESSQIAPFRHITKANSIIEAMNKDLGDNEKLDGFIFVVNDPVAEEVMEEVFSLPVATALISRLGGRGAHVGDIAKALGKVYVGQVKDLRKFFGKPTVLRFGSMDVVVGSKMIIHGQTGEIALYKTTK